MMGARAWPLVICLGAAGCTEDLTQLLVVVDSDVALDAVAVAVRPSTAPEGEAPTELSGALPVSFGVLPPGGDVASRVRIEVEGRVAGQAVLRAVRVSPFLPKQTARLEIFLAAACLGQSCPAGNTCDRGAQTSWCRSGRGRSSPTAACKRPCRSSS